MTIARRRLVIAFAVSLLLHGTLTVAWLRTRPLATTSFAGESTEVDTPDDREFTMTLLESRAAIPPVVAKEPSSAPSTLTPTIMESKVDSAANSGISQSAYSPVADGSLPKSSNSNPLHGKPKTALSIVYILDRSSSMGTEGRLARACDSIRASLDQLNSDSRFQIVAYNGGAVSFSTQFVEATPANRERASRWLDGLIAEGRSEHRLGFREALWLHPNAMFLLTDADDFDEKEVKAIRNLMREPIHLSVALFGSRKSKNQSPLTRLVEDSRGRILQPE